MTLVTGASRGIGRAIAERLAREGHELINLSRSYPGKDFPGVSYSVDLSDAKALGKVLEKLCAEHSVDNLVNNAAPGERAVLEKIAMAELDRMVDTNLRAAILLAQAIVPGMRTKGRGRIVNIGSRAALGLAGLSVYGAIKGALVSATRSWALELARDGITVNAVAPGPIATAMFDKNFPPDSPRRNTILASIPVGRIGAPADVAAAVAFLLSDDASFITGQTLNVCGGLSISSTPF
ncbi:SDR family oxidoreductase [Taklimakanibacter deserti]|uniref:SDR family oxidoreductase n=1 Tax=Taklimakanibacter deserti TaxID=2267839 RepID=UPI0034D4B7BE